jgi:hypothetical protein
MFGSFEEVQRDLEALKLQLAAMEAPDLPQQQAEALATEISAIRLHLKRLELDRAALAAELDRLLHDDA